MFKYVFSFVFFVSLFVSLPANAANTFPVETAGIAAYVKLDSFDLANFENAKNNLFDSVETAGDSFVIGLKKYNTVSTGTNEITPRIYLSANGWLVVYFLKTEEPSKIVNWRAAAPLGDTMLKVIIEDAAAKIGVGYSGPIRYYDFSHPEANKLTLVREKAEGVSGSDMANDFTVLVPGTVQQASYAIYCAACTIASWRSPASIALDGAQVSAVTDATGAYVYGNYALDKFEGGKSHKVNLDREGTNDHPAAATLIIYKTN